ncbi:MAG: UdgX family uracil-DNA binding protein, partial [Polaromonas sp.]
EFLTLCESVILHSDPGRFGLLYRILWRLVHEPGLRHDPLDADMMKAQHMAQAVRRDMHKMKAFVRFRSVQDETFRSRPEDGPLHVAWFEPEHHIVEAVAPFFARRFTQMRWAILTPECSVEWRTASRNTHDFLPALPAGGTSSLSQTGTLVFGPGARKEDAPPPDAGEQLWLTYYQHIFNRARLKVKMMQKEMPRKYWKNLPEADMIQTLVSGASESSLRMIEQPATVTARRMPSSTPATPIRIIHEAVHADSYRVPAPKPDSLAALYAATSRCRECPIGACATQAVNGEGPIHAGIMFVGEQPGDHEDVHGKPFVGPAGQLLDRALAELSINRDTVFVSNAVRHFKYELHGKRRIHKTPSQREAAACLHWLEDEIALVKPGILVALGATAARSLMGRAIPVTASRGQILEREDGQKVLITLHPSALLRLPPEAYDEAYAAWLQDLSRLKSH